MNVIVGTGLAAVRAAEAMREVGSSEPIMMVGSELSLPYERPPLSKELLRGAMTPADALLHPEDYYAAHGIELVRGSAATGLDLRARSVQLANGQQLSFGRLLIATGATPRRLHVPGETLDGILYLRSLDDSVRLRAALDQAERVVVVGGGFIGLEVAAVARAAGRTVTLLEAGRQPLARLLHGAEVAGAIAKLHRDQGVDLRTETRVNAFLGGGRLEGVELSTGERLPADIALVAVGVVPTTDWLVGSGLRLDDGVLVDAELRTNHPAIFAAGDVARAFLRETGRHARFEQYGAAHEQGRAAGRAMAGLPSVPSITPGAGSEQFGVRMSVLGATDDHDRIVICPGNEDHAFAALFVRGPVVRGAFVMGRAKELPAVRQLVRRNAPLDEFAFLIGTTPLRKVEAPR
ncbi:MAG: FAD-dependent oxidoreductase [Labilithrix sp.]|nr:FAD-dependent oxidoreductase [Labilithrix sp.]MCW5811584.1 FAD-dependent oxidoreductase [Labilithrix sp.]